MHTLETIRDGILLAVLAFLFIVFQYAFVDFPLDRALQ